MLFDYNNLFTSNINCFERHAEKGTISSLFETSKYCCAKGKFKLFSRRFNDLKVFTAEQWWWFKRRSFIDFTRIIGVGCFLARCVPFWTSSASFSGEGYLTVKIYYVIIPLLLLDAVVVIVYGVSQNNKSIFYGERKYPLIVYSLLFGFPLGTLLKILVSLRFGGVHFPDYVLIIFGAILCSLPMMAIFFFFLTALFPCNSYGFGNCSEYGRKAATRFLLFLIVSAYVTYHTVSLVSLLDRLFPSIVVTGKENEIFNHFEKSSWLSLLIPLWMTLFVLFVIGIYRSLHLLLKSRLCSC